MKINKLNHHLEDYLSQQDGQIEVESVSMEICNCAKRITLKGPVLEVKGRVKVNTK